MRFAIKKEKNEKDPDHLYSSPRWKAECYQAPIQSQNYSLFVCVGLVSTSHYIHFKKASI